MTSLQILKYRLSNQHLTRNECKTPSELVAFLGAVQAQDYAAAKWAIGLRLPGSTDADIERAIADREIVRSWTLRGTLHFVAGADLRWILELLTPRLVSIYAGYFWKLGLEKSLIRKSHATMANALRDGNQLTRQEIVTLLNRKGIPTHDLRINFLLIRAAWDGLICLGQRRGKQFTYTLLDEWIASSPKLNPQEAITKLAKRYFASHGPATIHDFAWWSGLTISDIKTAMEIIGPSLHSEKIGQSTFWWAKNSLPAKSSTAYLLPSFDEYMVGYADRSAALDKIPFKRILNGSVFNPTIVINGKIAGTWKRTVKKNTLSIESSFFEALTRSQIKTVEMAGRKYGKFLEMNADLKIGK